jgi:16S rRNA (adenine1518-N6/adenine1519-N6)-dimethyltransferase
MRDERSDQHVMVDKDVLIRVVNLADLNKEDTVIEIGGGAGALTQYLLKIAKQVYVYEKDIKYVPEVEEKFGGWKNVIYTFGNAMEVDFPPFEKCVSNLPYTLCESLLWKFTRYKFDCLVFVVPKPFAERLVGKRVSRLKLLVDAFYEVELFDDIYPESFDPPPKVISKIIRLTPKEGNPFLGELFTQYDKKVKNALREILMRGGLTKREATEQIAMNIRPAIQDKKVVNLTLNDIKLVIKGFVGEE